jgi:hypothetical protein
MTQTEFLRKVRKKKPKNADEFRKIAPLRSRGSGAYREAFTIVGQNLVVKFPRLKRYRKGGPAHRANIAHARREMYVIGQIKKRDRFKHLRRYLPKIFYMDWKRGIIVMEKLNFERVNRAWFKRQQEMLSIMVEDTAGMENGGPDIGWHNVGEDNIRRMKIVDLGLF